jgi:alpha-1,2-mannosyltransferase
MVPLSRQGLVVIGGTCVLFGLYGWAIFLTTFGHDGAIGPRYNAPGADWVVFYSAAQAWLGGDLSLIFDGQRFTDYQNAAFTGWLSGPMPFAPWLYPPHFLLLILPFGLLPFAWSYAVFMAATFAALLAAVWRHFAPGERSLQVISLLLCPATSITLVTGQNSFLSGALLFGGFSALDRYPVVAGAMLGALSFKPSLALMVPVALIAARQWRALAAAGATALVLAVASLAVLGIEPWREWLLMMVSPSADYRHWLDAGRSWGLSLYTCATLLGASAGAANLVQMAATVSAAAVVFWTFRQPLPADRRLALLLAAAIFAAPHVSTYDTILLALAAGLLFRRALVTPLPFPLAAVILAAWLLPLINPPRATPLGLATPLIVALMMVSAIAGVRAKAPIVPSPLVGEGGARREAAGG